MHDAYISLPGKARVDVDNQALTSITHSFSRSSPAQGVTGRLVYVGDGDAADFNGRDLHGAIVLTEGIASPGQAARASHAGAVGQIQISPHEHLHEMCVSPVWGSPSGETQSDLPTTVVCTVSNADGSALRERLARGEQPKVTLHAAVDTGWRQTPILVAEIDGPTTDGPFILYSGHHDTWYYGVMDNGAANATMLEVARVAAGERNKWRRGLRLCFWSGHSHGRYSGSTWYADQHWDELERRCAVHVNVDSTGGIGATVLKNAAAAPELVGLAGDAIGEQAGSDYAGKRMSRSSDQSFWGIGIPAMFGALSEQPPAPVKMRNALGWWWHTPHDLLDKIDEKNLVRDTRVYVHTLWRLLTDPVLPLDFAAHANVLLDELATLQSSLGDRCSVAGLVAGAETLREQGCRRRPQRCGIDACVARTGAGVLHQRRPLRPRSRAAPARLAGARSAAQAGEGRARHRQRALPRRQCHARPQPTGVRTARGSGGIGRIMRRLPRRSSALRSARRLR